MSYSIAIVGAGISGLVTAKTLLDFSHSVTIYDKSDQVGGVWSSSRRYPGLKSQNPKETYCFSTLPMPESYPTHPDGEQIQKYLESYVVHHQLDKRGKMKLGTEVVSVTQVDGGRWAVTSRCNSKTEIEYFDKLVVAVGTFSQPFIPTLRNYEDFVGHGGRILHTSEVHDYAQFQGKNVVILGYGKSACDAAVQAQKYAKQTHIVVRRVTWKLPTYIGGALHYSYLLLTRMGESLFKYIRPWKTQRFLHSPVGSLIRMIMLGSLAMITRLQLQLNATNLTPKLPFESIACSTIALATDGLSQAIKSGRVIVHRDNWTQFLGSGGVSLARGGALDADVIICGTGYTQDVPLFLPINLDSILTDSERNWVLYRHILPIGVDNLYFNGYNSSLFTPLTSEVAALWIASHLNPSSFHPNVDVPNQEEMERNAREMIQWMENRTSGKHSKGTCIIPFSMSHIDELMDDLKVKIGWWDRLREWFLQVNPLAYSGLVKQVLRRDTRSD